MARFDVEKAVRANLEYSRTTNPPWGECFRRVSAALGFTNMSPGPEALAQAVYDWQIQQPGLVADGILGPRSWHKLRASGRLSDTSPVQQCVAPQTPMSGSVLVANGLASVVRIPVPGTNGLAIEFRSRGFTPRGGSTSTLFIQDSVGKRQLRLDYGYNVKTKTIDYHWNQQGTFSEFGIADHTPTGAAGRFGYQASKYFRYGGRVLLVVGAGLDLYSIVVATKPIQRATEVVSAWALAWAGCEVGGAGGAAFGSLFPGPGTAIGGVAGCIIGGVGGYMGGERIGREVFEWAEGTVFTPVPASSAP